MVRSPDSEEQVNLRGQNEIRLGQPIHCMRPGRNFDLTPSDQDVGMMALLLGQSANVIHKSQGGLKVRDFVSAHEVVLVDDVPLRRLRQLSMNLGEFVSL